MHDFFLNKAAQLAAAVDPHQTSPNPRVGCVVVRDQKIIVTGTHETLGGAHAEINALKNLKAEDLKTALVYITLEPCVNYKHKKTPACTDRLLSLKPAQIIIGALDTHFPGQGVAQLRDAGINVVVLNTLHHRHLNPWFETWHTQVKPFITLKVAQSLDGKITPSFKDYQTGSRAITGRATQIKVHELRATHQAILTSTETILEDDPRLDVRQAENLEFKPTAPDLIVVGRRKIPQTANIFKTPNRKIYLLEDLKDLIPLCRKHQIASVMTECGGTLNTALIETGLVDQIEIFTAPIICGETAKPSFLKKLNLEKYKLKKRIALENDFQLTYDHLSPIPSL